MVEHAAVDAGVPGRALPVPAAADPRAGRGRGAVAHHAESGAGRFTHPLGEFAAFPELGEPGAELRVTARAPVDEGEGLVVYAWLDVDGDGILCAPGVTDEPAGLVEVDLFPAHALSFTLTLTATCSGPEALYP